MSIKYVFTLVIQHCNLQDHNVCWENSETYWKIIKLKRRLFLESTYPWGGDKFDNFLRLVSLQTQKTQRKTQFFGPDLSFGSLSAKVHAWCRTWAHCHPQRTAAAHLERYSCEVFWVMSHIGASICREAMVGAFHIAELVFQPWLSSYLSKLSPIRHPIGGKSWRCRVAPSFCAGWCDCEALDRHLSARYSLAGQHKGQQVESYQPFITPITMVYGIYNYIVTGANLNQLISWGPHIVQKQIEYSDFNPCLSMISKL